MSAILLYVRATSTGGSKNERGSIQLDLKKLTTKQKEDHNTLIRLRNSAVGHVETGTNIAGDFWHRDFLFAKGLGPGNWEIASASTSIGFHFATMDILKRQLPIATELVTARCQQRLGDAISALRDARPSDAMMLRYEVNPIEWFGSAEAALMALKARPGEELSAWLPLL